jgi:hypothetical protein
VRPVHSASLALGSWRLRHGEPLAAADRDLLILPIAKEVDLASNSHDLTVNDLPGLQTFLRPDCIPLAILAGERETAPIAFFLLSFKQDRCLFVKPWEAGQENGPLWLRIESMYSRLYLQLNNNECFYTTAKASPPKEIVEISPVASYWRLGQTLFAALDDGAFGGFAVQFRCVPKIWSADVAAFGPERPAVQPGTHAFVSFFGRNKERWRAAPVTIEAVSPGRGGSVTHHSSFEVTADAEPLESLVSRVIGYAVRESVRWRRLAFEIPIESKISGNIYALSVERIIPQERVIPCRQFIRLEYSKSRGGGAGPAQAEAEAEAELLELAGLVKQWISREALILPSAHAVPWPGTPWASPGGPP